MQTPVGVVSKTRVTQGREASTNCDGQTSLRSKRAMLAIDAYTKVDKWNFNRLKLKRFCSSDFRDRRCQNGEESRRVNFNQVQSTDE